MVSILMRHRIVVYGDMTCKCVNEINGAVSVFLSFWYTWQV